MNYYPFHLGDYAAHTAHLEPLEDLAYRRMLDLYYLREQALPEDTSEIARLIRMRANVAEVEAVLREFFTNNDGDGWIHLRCEAEISKMQDRQATSEAKAAHETERMRRHRERRGELFALLRERGCVPAWDTPIKELQRLANMPATDLQREQAVSGQQPATAIPTPIPTPKEEKARTRAAPVARPPDVDEQVWADWLHLRKSKRAPVTQTTLNGAVTEAEKAGMTLEAFLRVWCRRGSQGLEAAWLKPEEKPVQTPAASSIASGNAELQRAREQAARAVPPPAAVLELAKRMRVG
jgi:uncharacterized protein YdaU (DUF1376 family)